MDTFWTVARVVVSLAVVLGLVWALGQAARRRGTGGAQAAVTVIGRQPLSRSASVAVVRVGGQALVLGVTDSSVTLLGRVDPAEVVAPTEIPAETSAPAPAATAQQASPAFEHVLAAVGAQPQPATRAELRARTGSISAAPPEQPVGSSVLAGSALSPATWTRAVGVLRERSARR